MIFIESLFSKIIFLIILISSRSFFGFCKASITDLLSLHITWFLFVWEANITASCSAAASAVKAEQYVGRAPTEIVAPALFVTANVVLVSDLDPSVKMNSHSAWRGSIASL